VQLRRGLPSGSLPSVGLPKKTPAKRPSQWKQSFLGDFKYFNCSEKAPQLTTEMAPTAAAKQFSVRFEADSLQPPALQQHPRRWSERQCRPSSMAWLICVERWHKGPHKLIGFSLHIS